jgi:soluble cytochrome b562
MLKHAKILSAAAAGLALGGLLLAPAARGRDEIDKEAAMKAAAAREAVLKLVADLGNEDAAKKEATDLAKKHDLKYVMYQFRPRDKGGLGVGDKPGAAAQDSIELELLQLGAKKPLSPKEFAAQQADLAKMAQVVQAVALVTPHYAANDNRKPSEIKDWNRYSDDMLRQSKDLAAAIQSGEPKKVQTAANTLNGSCNACHTAFRDKDN